MKKEQMKRILVLIFVGLFVLPYSIHAIILNKTDDVTLTVQTETTVLAGEQFRVRFTVNSQNVSNFVAPDFKGFEVIYGPASSRQSSFQFINGKSSQNSSITFTYILLASKPGTYMLTPASIQCDGKTIKSHTVSIKVLSSDINNGSTSSSSNINSSKNQSSQHVHSNNIQASDLFMTATVNKTNAYEQEAILLTYKIYTLVNLTELDGKLPTLDGFQIQEIPLPRNKEFRLEQYKGKNYRTVVWSQYLLFPQKTGKLTIPSIVYEGNVVQPNKTIDPIDAFFNGNSGILEIKKQIKTPSISININPLPKKDTNFSGAVGNFSILSSINNKKIQANDALTFKITFKGIGNMKLINPPKIAFPADFDVYDCKIVDNFQITNNGLFGTKSFEYPIIPRRSGTYIIPATQISYFNISTRKYEMTTIPSQSITVINNQGGVSNNLVDYGERQQNIHNITNDILYIKTGKALFCQYGKFYMGVKIGLLYLVTLVIFALACIVGKKIFKNNLKSSNNKTKQKNAIKKLKKIKILLHKNDKEQFYDNILKVLYDYIADKLHISKEDLSKECIEIQSMQQNVSSETTHEYLQLLADCEYAHFVSHGSDENMEAIYERALSVIEKIENHTKK